MPKLANDDPPRAIVAMGGGGFSFRNRDLAEVVASRPTARGYRVVRGPGGRAVETERLMRYLG